MRIRTQFTLALTLGLLSASLIGCASPKPAPPTAARKEGVALHEGDPLMQAIEQRFGRPDRVTGSGRAFLHYDLSNGDTVTLVVSGNKIIGLQHDQKPK
jgi:hypothetical protein